MLGMCSGNLGAPGLQWGIIVWGKFYCGHLFRLIITGPYKGHLEEWSGMEWSGWGAEEGLTCSGA